jgi:septal ring factor EnvC (AmiA/AmiB activator)
MTLEKSQSSEAGLAGWISTNDVTLFTMILVVVIALVMHVNLKTTEEHLEENKDTLANTQDTLANREDALNAARQEKERLDAELAARRQLLRETEEALKTVENQSDELKIDLDDALALVRRLETDKSGLETDKTNLLGDKSALEDEQARLLAAKTVLETDKDELTRLRDSLANEKITLSDKMAALAVQLNNKVKALQDAEAQRDRLKEQADNLDAIVATLQQKLNLTTKNMEDLKTQANTQARDLQKRADDESARAEDYLARLRRAAELFKGLQDDKRTLQSEVTTLEQEYRRQVAREATLSRELVGVQGGLKRVAFLFDASGSMKKQGTGTVDRWLEAQQIAATWLAHLDVDECVLIVYSTRVGTYPADGTFIGVSGPEGAANRKVLLDKLNAVQPQGVTNTLDALRKAYDYEGLDTIVLFSDGAPTSSTSGEFDPRIAQQIYELCRQHTDIPINTIGLGDYFDANMGTFLRNLARLTGGTFRGR